MNETIQYITAAIQYMALAGIVGAALTFILERVGKYRDRRRELRGLLSALQDEVVSNDRITKVFLKDPRYARDTYMFLKLRFPTWERTAWKDSATRIAQLMKKEEFGRLSSYYALLTFAQMSHSNLLATENERLNPEEIFTEEDARKARREGYPEEDIRTAREGVTEEEVSKVYETLASHLRDLREASDEALKVIHKHVPPASRTQDS